jgi:cerevisin
MATPHVAGTIAYLIGNEGNLPPAEMANKLNSLAVSGVLSGIRKCSPLFLEVC